MFGDEYIDISDSILDKYLKYYVSMPNDPDSAACSSETSYLPRNALRNIGARLREQAGIIFGLILAGRDYSGGII